LERLVFHVDVNSAFLSWEAAYRIHHLGGTLDLRSIPSAASGDQEARHGIILAKSIPSKQFGIQTGESVHEALQKCPGLYLVPPNYNLYERCSHAFIELLKEYSPDVEQYSIDECFMDMSGTKWLFPDPIQTAELIRERISHELGFTVNIGISDNKLLAKMASDFRKPDRVHTLFKEEMQKKMWPLPVKDLFYVGRASAGKLYKLGIYTIGQLAQADPNVLKAHLKSHGLQIWNFANGIDLSPVQPVMPANKGYGNSTTIAFDVQEAETAKNVLLALAETVSARLRKDKVKAEVISIGIRYADFQQISHQMTLNHATNITIELHQYACRLFDELWNRKPIRHLGIHTARIKDGGELRQLSFFDLANFEKWEDMDRAVDQIRLKYGIDAVKRAVFIRGSIDHLSGGVSREKRTVAYDRLVID